MYIAEGVFRRGIERNLGWIGLRDAREIGIGLTLIEAYWGLWLAKNADQAI